MRDGEANADPDPPQGVKHCILVMAPPHGAAPVDEQRLHRALFSPEAGRASQGSEVEERREHARASIHAFCTTLHTIVLPSLHLSHAANQAEGGVEADSALQPQTCASSGSEWEGGGGCIDAGWLGNSSRINPAPASTASPSLRTSALPPSGGERRTDLERFQGLVRELSTRG
ncbi:hypothetical protein T484DRAFT_1917726, partial [Baffinella frigidus]